MASGDGNPLPHFHPRVYVSKVYGHPRQRLVTGTWNFPDDWAGQEDPIDSAALTTNLPRCYHIKSLHVDTYDVNFKATHRGNLRNANVGSNSPIWDINDQAVGFNDQADSGAVSVIFKRKCKRRHANLGAEFVYQATEHGSVLSVSAGWKFLTVNTSGRTLKRQTSTKPLYFRF